MIEENSNFTHPANNKQKIWRYMDFTKFVDLLYTSSLFFSTAEILEDKFEGSISLPTANARMEAIQEIYKDIDEKRSDKLAIKLDYTKDPFSPLYQALKKQVCINCWHMSEYESAAMWKLYSKSNEGIAIQSTYKRLIGSLSHTDVSIHVGIVNYIDFENETFDFGSCLAPYVHKRKSFEHEKELRAFIWAVGGDNEKKCKVEDGGLKISIDLNELVEKIYISPSSPKWFTTLIQAMVEKHAHKLKVKSTDLNIEPLY